MGWTSSSAPVRDNQIMHTYDAVRVSAKLLVPSKIFKQSSLMVIPLKLCRYPKWSSLLNLRSGDRVWVRQDRAGIFSNYQGHVYTYFEGEKVANSGAVKTIGECFAENPCNCGWVNKTGFQMQHNLCRIRHPLSSNRLIQFGSIEWQMCWYRWVSVRNTQLSKWSNLQKYPRIILLPNSMQVWSAL